MPTFTGTSTRGLSFIGQSAPDENLVILYDTRPFDTQPQNRKGVLLLYQFPPYVPAGLSGILVAESTLWVGAVAGFPRRLLPGLPTLILVRWLVDGVPYRIDTGFTG